MAPFSAATRKTLAFFVGTTALAQLGWALGPASIMRRELANACGADEDACAADETCLACAEIFLAKEPCRGPDYNYDTASCDEIVEGMCCAIQVAEDTGAGCETNELFLALYDCENRCGQAPSDCPGKRDPSTVATSATTRATACGVDVGNCEADWACNTCIEVFRDSVEACHWDYERSDDDAYSYDYSFDSSATARCSEGQTTFCCAIQAVEDAGCQMSDMFLALYDCYHPGCEYSLKDCGP